MRVCVSCASLFTARLLCSQVKEFLDLGFNPRCSYLYIYNIHIYIYI